MSAELRGLLFEFLASEKMNERMNVFAAAAAAAAAAKGLSGATQKKLGVVIQYLRHLILYDFMYFNNKSRKDRMRRGACLDGALFSSLLIF